MFYEIRDNLVEIDSDNINPDILTVGCISSEELLTLGSKFGFDDYTVSASQKVNPLYQTGVDVHATYTFAEIKIINGDSSEDSVSFYLKKNFILIVDIEDEDSSTVSSFLEAIKKYPANKVNEERLISCFVELLLFEGSTVIEEMHNRLTEMEESVVRGKTKSRFNIELLDIKKEIRKYYNYYSQILDITQTLSDNENDILNKRNLIYISNLNGKITRLRDDMNFLLNIADHVQDAYATLLDQRMSNTMKFLTILSTVFFPLTIIVGWYGMNFKYMPELTWRYGYLYVILLSITVVVSFIMIARKKKWF